MEQSINTLPSAIELASTPMILISGAMRPLFETAFSLSIPTSEPIARGEHIRTLLNRVSGMGYQLKVTGFEQISEKRCQLQNVDDGSCYEVWGRNTAEAVLRCCSLAALKEVQTSLAI